MTSPGFRPTHVVPQRGMPAWETPDPARPTVPLDPLLPVRLVERRGDWAQVLCSNGWSAWVDGRHLVAVPQDPPLPDAPLAGTADPRPLLGRTEQALARYRAAVEDLAGGGLDGETFHRRTRGLRIGVVVDGESVWLYDPARFRWVYGDGSRLSTYAADDPPAAARDDGRDGDRDSDRDGDRDAGPRGGPDADPDVGHAPTRVVTPDGERR
ncbi:hypothetical protein [Streptomyces sp. NPDC003522]